MLNKPAKNDEKCTLLHEDGHTVKDSKMAARTGNVNCCQIAEYI